MPQVTQEGNRILIDLEDLVPAGSDAGIALDIEKIMQLIRLVIELIMSFRQ